MLDVQGSKEQDVLARGEREKKEPDKANGQTSRLKERSRLRALVSSWFKEANGFASTASNNADGLVITVHGVLRKWGEWKSSNFFAIPITDLVYPQGGGHSSNKQVGSRLRQIGQICCHSQLETNNGAYLAHLPSNGENKPSALAQRKDWAGKIRGTRKENEEIAKKVSKNQRNEQEWSSSSVKREKQQNRQKWISGNDVNLSKWAFVIFNRSTLAFSKFTIPIFK